MSCNTLGGLLVYYYINMGVNIIMIMAPIILLVLGTIDFMGAVTASDEKGIGKSIQTFTKRMLICVIILILPTVISLIMSFSSVESTLFNCLDKATKENIKAKEAAEAATKEAEVSILKKLQEDLKKQQEESKIQKEKSTSIRNQIIELAQQQVGTKENPMGSNRVKYNTWYYGSEVSGKNYAWCQVFVSWIANQVGVLDTKIKRDAGCRFVVTWFKNKGQWRDASYTPNPADIIYYDYDGDQKADHVGIVEYVENGRVHTIEGNCGDMVCRNKANNSQILGYGVPDY